MRTLDRSITILRHLALVALFFLTHWNIPETASAEADPDQSVEEFDKNQDIILAWLECEECQYGELKSVVALGKLAVPSLAAALQVGPSPASLEELRLYLIETYQQLQREQLIQRKHRLWTVDQYVNEYLQTYMNLYQVRAAKALGTICTPDAKTALVKNLPDTKSATVMAAVEAAQKMCRVPIFTQPSNEGIRPSFAPPIKN